MANLQSKKVIIASANTLFSKGLKRLLIDTNHENIKVVAMPTSLQDTIGLMDQLSPDIVVFDYDDTSLTREAFLDYFMAGEQPMRVLLISLQHTGLVTVYDRISFAPSAFEDLLSMLI